MTTQKVQVLASLGVDKPYSFQGQGGSTVTLVPQGIKVRNCESGAEFAAAVDLQDKGDATMYFEAGQTIWLEEKPGKKTRGGTQKYKAHRKDPTDFPNSGGGGAGGGGFGAGVGNPVTAPRSAKPKLSWANAVALLKRANADMGTVAESGQASTLVLGVIRNDIEPPPDPQHEAAVDAALAAIPGAQVVNDMPPMAPPPNDGDVPF